MNSGRRNRTFGAGTDDAITETVANKVGGDLGGSDRELGGAVILVRPEMVLLHGAAVHLAAVRPLHHCRRLPDALDLLLLVRLVIVLSVFLHWSVLLIRKIVFFFVFS